MATRGTKPRPHLEVVREGNPGKRKRREGLKLDPNAPAEPDWGEWFDIVAGPGSEASLQCTADAARAWSTIVAELDKVGALSAIDVIVLADACVCWARIRQCERDITRNGIWTEGERGAQKNPSVTAANQFRTQLKFYVAELGLAPSSRSRLTGGKPDHDPEDDPFDP